MNYIENLFCKLKYQKLPIIISESLKKAVDDNVDSNIELSKTDWDSFETSWDFKKHPLI